MDHIEKRYCTNCGRPQDNWGEVVGKKCEERLKDGRNNKQA